MNINSIIAANTVISRFAPSHSGTMGFRKDGYDVTIFAIERCDCCNKEVEGANSITIVKPRGFVMDVLTTRNIVDRSDIMDEGGCNDDGDFVCPSCYKEG